jgi:DNA phosphorothioation-dependent restriction protein DptH
VTFEVAPHPKQIRGLDHFTVQIISGADGPVGKSKKVKAWTPKRTTATASLLKLNKIEFEEGWHFVRVLPWTAEGDPIPLESVSGAEEADRPFESEPFYVLPNGAMEEEPPQRAIPIEQSLEHARLRLQLTALGDERDPGEIAVSGISWAEGRKARPLRAKRRCWRSSDARVLFRSRFRAFSRRSSSGFWLKPPILRDGACRSIWIRRNRPPKLA